MNKKRLLMCYHSSEYGGVEKQILDIINGLSEKLEIIVVCPEGPMVKEYLRGGAIKHIALSPRHEADLQYSLQIRQLIILEKIDIIHSHELLTGSLATFGAWLAKFRKPNQRIYHVHTPFSWWRHNFLKSFPALFINTFVNFIVGNFFATDVLALTPSIKRHRIFKEFISPTKIRVLPNGVENEYFSFSQSQRNSFRTKWKIPADAFVIGNISRFTKEKGHEVLINAFSQIKRQNPDKNMFLLLAGYGILLNEMKSLSKSLGVYESTIFTDKFLESDKIGILSAIDLFVFPSYAEGFGIAILESMSMGIPTVASNLPVLKDVGGDAVIYAKTGDISDFVNKMSVISTKRATLIKRAALFSMRNFIKNYSGLYGL